MKRGKENLFSLCLRNRLPAFRQSILWKTVSKKEIF